MSGFTHLHVHTEYSLLDGASRIKDVLDRAKALGMDSLAITDHGVMYGVPDFYEYARKIGVKPIIGCEVYIVDDRFEKTFAKKEYAHLILLAKDYDGYKNLMRLVTLGSTQGFYYKPRIDYKLLRELHGGLVCLSACLAGDVARRLLVRDYAGAKRYAEELRDIFGGDFYLEIMDHGLKEQREINPLLIRLSNETGIPLVATNDVHYTEKEDSTAQDALMCIQTGTHLNDENKLTFETQEFYLKSQEEMAELFANIPEALARTQEIAEKCNLEIEYGVMHLPIFDVPQGVSFFDYLYGIAKKGLLERYPEPTQEILDRFEYEIRTIDEMGFVNYFLIVWDFVRYAKEQGIAVGPGRGSAAGSIVAYALGITNIDPIRYSLLFERFLNPERVTMPDIDIDFCYERRGEIIDYVVRKYGEDRVSQIITFGTMGARLVIRDVARVMDVPIAEADKLAKMVPFELKMTIDRALEINPRLKMEYDNNENARKVIDIARRLEGMPRHASTHAAGVVIADGPIMNYVPLQLNPKDEGVVTQYTMGKLESMGLLKMDFLGLRTLTVIRDTVEMAAARTGKMLDIDHIDITDQKVYAMIAQGDTDGVFQLESPGMRRLMQDLKPANIDEIMVGISLFRPGPMDYIPEYIRCKNDPNNVQYAHPLLEPILKDTYGCIVYQEQVMRMVRDLAGYSMGRSDLVRRAMSKKKTDVLERERDVFINGETKDGRVTVEGAVARGVPRKTAEELFGRMMEFAKYAFNKSHACAYAFVAYQTAYLKYYYPVEFWCALLNSYLAGKQKLAEYIQAVKSAGIRVLPPDVNRSQMKFTVEDGAIRFGFSAIANVGEAIDNVVSEREMQPYRDFADFVKRNVSVLNKKRLECMILSGCFDSLGYTRAALMAAYDTILAEEQNHAKRQLSGQMSLFDTAGEEFARTAAAIPARDEFPMMQKLGYEKAMTGIYISGHPLEQYPETEKLFAHSVSGIVKTTEDEMTMFEYDGKDVEVVGVISEVKPKLTRAKQMMANLRIEDKIAQMGVLVFPKTFAECEQILQKEAIVCVSGRVTVGQGQGPEIIAQRIEPYVPDDAEYAGKKLYIRIKKDQKDAALALLRRYPGRNPVWVHLAETKRTYQTKPPLTVRMTRQCADELTALLGEENVKFR